MTTIESWKADTNLMNWARSSEFWFLRELISTHLTLAALAQPGDQTAAIRHSGTMTGIGSVIQILDDISGALPKETQGDDTTAINDNTSF